MNLKTFRKNFRTRKSTKYEIAYFGFGCADTWISGLVFLGITYAAYVSSSRSWAKLVEIYIKFPAWYTQANQAQAQRTAQRANTNSYNTNSYNRQNTYNQQQRYNQPRTNSYNTNTYQQQNTYRQPTQQRQTAQAGFQIYA